jgi:trehalose synthase
MKTQKLTIVDTKAKRLKDYSKITPDVIRDIKKIAKRLSGLKVGHVNATAVGGGVAEMLRSEVPLQKDIGIESSWYVIPPNDDFFEITKSIHNFMQGKPGNLTKGQQKFYLEYNQYIGELLSEIEADIFIIHDPQPAAALKFMKKKPKVAIWRSHIDTSNPNRKVWDFLRPYLEGYDHYVFTLPQYTNDDFEKENVSFITPVIDPLNAKNKALPKAEAKKYLKRLGIDTTRPLITQVSRLDPWKDPEGVIDAYRKAKDKVPDLQLALVAQMADDDPEGVIIHNQIKEYVGNDKDIYLMVNLDENDRAVNAFQVGSDIILQKSIREGFGLTVTEAMWKGAVVIGGNVGGIKIQIKDRVSGYLVDSSKEAAERIVELLGDKKKLEKMSKAAHQSVKEKFLIPHKKLNYLRLFEKLLKEK